MLVVRLLGASICSTCPIDIGIFLFSLILFFPGNAAFIEYYFTIGSPFSFFFLLSPLLYLSIHHPRFFLSSLLSARGTMHESFDGVDFLDISDLSHEDAEAYVVKYRYNGQLFSVLISTTPPEGCEREGAIELSWIDRLWDLSSHLGEDHARLVEQDQGEMEIAREIRNAVFPTLERLAPSPTLAGDSEPGPVQKSVAEYLFPSCIRLELVTKNGELEVLSGHGEELDRKRMVVPWSVMGEIGFERGSVPVFDARDVLLGPRLVTSPLLMDVFDVSVLGAEERVVGKLGCAMDDSQQAMRREMEIYGRLRKSSLDFEARVPELKGG